MDSMQIDCLAGLARLLRDSGDKVLNANFKLTLSGFLLRSLNDSFPLIADQNEIYAPQTFQVVKPNHSKSDVFRDLQFIHDFVQKTKILSITQFHCDDKYENHVDISKFRSLKRLEIQRVYIKQIIGIQQMRAHLQEIICQKSIDHIEDIISHCGGDNCTGFVWNELKLADFSYNNLQTIDCSLEFAPWLQHLNLSHNQITSVDAIKWLPNLKFLNLSFNRLTHIPMFHMDASKRLKSLILSHNYIEDVTEVSRLNSLNDLDLSGNCILDHSLLMPISTLISLQYLNLEDNPLACSLMHRQATSRHLHKNTSSVKFILDSEPLSKSEKALTGTYHSYNLILTSRVSMGTFSSSNQSTPLRQTQDNTPASSFSSRNSNRFNDMSTALMHTNSQTSIDEMNASSTSSIINRVTTKKVKARHAIIADVHHDNEIQPAKETTIVIPALEGCKNHLETKKQIEKLREQHGNDWLFNHGENITPTDNNQITRQSREAVESLLETISVETPKQTPLDEKPEIIFDAINPNNATPTNTIENTNELLNEEREIDILNEVYAPTQKIEEISDGEDNEVTYIVYQEPSNIEIFLVVSDVSIKEKDILTAKTKTKWSIKTLESCDQIKCDVLRLNFDTIKKDKKERIYKVEKGLCQKLEQYLRNILSKRPLSEMNQTLYRCVNCTTQFSRENNYKKQNIDVYCPECKSAYVIEIKESPRGQSIERIGQTSQQSHQQQLHHRSDGLFDKVKALAMQSCESQSSIGSATSLNESSSCSKISKSNSFDSNQSVAGSSNCDRDADFQSKTGTNAGDSDIEILSNPSQSSIEVLDTFHSNRKYSEERRVSQIPSLDPITDNSYNSLHTLVNQQTSTQDLNDSNTDYDSAIDSGYDTTIVCAETDKQNDNDKEKKMMILSGIQLTESSSSGSVTDSICTTYELNRQVTDVVGGSLTPELTRIPKKSPEKVFTRADSSVISSMLGGLFQSTNNLMSRTQKPASPELPCEEYKFSYTDFDTVDHRLKLFLYQNIFEDDNEHLKWLVKGKMCYDNNYGIDERTTNSVYASTIFNGIFVMSTTKFYVLQIFASEREDVSKWLKRTLSGTIDRLEMIRVLPWKIGISFTIKNADNVILFLQDISRTDNLLLFFANNPLSDFCTLEYQISERLSQKLLKITNNTQLRMLAILNSINILLCTDNTVTHNNVAFIVTESNLYITSAVNQWMSEKSDAATDIIVEQTQVMSNLVEIEKIDNKSIRINFIDDTNDRTELWTCLFETCENVDSTLNAISQSWEQLFGVPLGIN